MDLSAFKVYYRAAMNLFVPAQNILPDQPHDSKDNKYNDYYYYYVYIPRRVQRYMESTKNS